MLWHLWATIRYHLISFPCLLIDCYIIQTDLTLVGDITCIRQFFIFKDINIILMFMQLVSIGVHNYTKLCLQLTSEHSIGNKQ